jgi:CRISPR-associated protein Cmr5
MPSPRRKLEQERAADAYKKARQAQKSLKEYKEYVGLVKKLPAMISTNGLGQTLAFLAAQAKLLPSGAPNNSNVEGMLYWHVESWLTRAGDPKGPYEQKAGNEDQDRPPRKLLYRIINGDSVVYRRATAEAMAYLAWLKPLADGLLEKEQK